MRSHEGQPREEPAMPSHPNPAPDFRQEIQDALLSGAKPRNKDDEKLPMAELLKTQAYYQDGEGLWRKGDRGFVHGTFVSGYAYLYVCGRYRQRFKKPVPKRPFLHLPIHEKKRLLLEALRAGKPIPENPYDRIEVLSLIILSKNI